MKERIVYQTENGGVAVITPGDCGLTIKEIADKDVPTGKPYKIVNVSDIPSDYTQSDAWTVNEADLTDGVGA